MSANIAVSILVGAQAVLGAVNASQEYPWQAGAIAFLAVWSVLPTAIGWALVALAAWEREPKRRAAFLLATFIVGLAWLAALVLGAISGATNPDTAAHMGHFLWPPILCALGALTYLGSEVLLFVVRLVRSAA